MTRPHGRRFRSTAPAFRFSLVPLAALASALLLAAAPAAGQRVGVGGSHTTNTGGYLPGGPGVQAWASWDVLGFVRLQASAAREWGRETERRVYCGFMSPEGPPPTDCLEEDVRFFNTTTTRDLAVLLVTPEWLGLRVGAGRTWGRHGFDTGREGLATGRVETPVEGRERTLDGRGWTVLLEHADLLGTGATVRASWQAWRVDFGPCVMDLWSLCGEERFRRVTLGLGYRLF